jgi:hypothetical protein
MPIKVDPRARGLSELRCIMASREDGSTEGGGKKGDGRPAEGTSSTSSRERGVRDTTGDQAGPTRQQTELSSVTHSYQLHRTTQHILQVTSAPTTSSAPTRPNAAVSVPFRRHFSAIERSAPRPQTPSCTTTRPEPFRPLPASCLNDKSSCSAERPRLEQAEVTSPPLFHPLLLDRTFLLEPLAMEVRQHVLLAILLVLRRRIRHWRQHRERFGQGSGEPDVVGRLRTNQ